MADERRDQQAGRPRRDEPDDSPGDPRPGGKPYSGKPGGKPYSGKPGGKPYRGKPGGKPYRGKPYQGRPGGKPYRGKPPEGGRPGRGPPPDRRDDSQPPDRPGAEVQPDGPAPAAGAPRRHDRRVEYHHRQRPDGPRGQRGPWERDRRPRRPGGPPDRRGGFAPRPPAGPSASEVLGEDEEVVAGRRPVEEAFAARREAKRLLVVPERRAALERIVLHATTLRIPVVEVEGGTITAVSGFDGHQGVALVVAPRRWATLDEVLALARARAEPPFLLALDHLEDPQNVGTLLRSAEACGVHGVIFPTRGAAPISPAAIKTSAGAVEHLLLVPMPDLAGALVDLHARGVRVIGADGDASMTVREADLRGPIVIVTGSEGRGLNARVRKRVDLMARIPMRGQVASLNASVAGSVFLFEAAAQRDLPEGERSSEAEAGAAEAAAPAVHEAGPEPAPEAVEPAPGSAAEVDADDLLPEVPPPAAKDGS